MCGRSAVDVKDDAEGRTPLLWACLLRNKDTGMKIVQLLLERGADLNQRDNGGNSALLLATAVGNKKIVKHLLRDPQAKKSAARVDVNQKNGKGYTALVTAIQVPPLHHASLARRGTDVLMVVQDNYKVRAMADLRGNVAVAKLLIKCGADVNLDGALLLWTPPRRSACAVATLKSVR
jgi:ankyrin repeat protein